MKNYIKLMRPQHHLKNVLILLPIIFAGEFVNIPLLRMSILGFISFSFLSSAVYIINDIRDVESDRLHEIKRNRPIAAGTISKKKATLLLCMLFIISVIFNYIAAGVDFFSWFFFVTYFGINLSYSLGLKNIPLVDIILLVLGFLLRVLYGGAVTLLPVSNWMYLTVITMSFYLGLGKRRNEIRKNGNGARKVLMYYTPDFLDKNMYMCLALTIVFYSLWCVDQNTVAAKMGGNLLWTVPIVMLICMKYSMNIEGDSFGDPVDVILHDKLLLCLVALYGIGIFFSIYGQAIIHYVMGI